MYFSKAPTNIGGAVFGLIAAAMGANRGVRLIWSFA
jgi:hypothetical protein